MRTCFPLLQVFRIQFLVLLILFAGTIRVSPAQAVPIIYDLYGDITGWVEVDFEAPPTDCCSGVPYLSWNLTTTVGPGTLHWRDDSNWTDNYLMGDLSRPTAVLWDPCCPTNLSNPADTAWGLYLYMTLGSDSMSYSMEGWPPGAGPLDSVIVGGYGRAVPRGVPEPQTILLLAVGLLIVAAFEWRRHIQQGRKLATS